MTRRRGWIRRSPTRSRSKPPQPRRRHKATRNVPWVAWVAWANLFARVAERASEPGGTTPVTRASSPCARCTRLGELLDSQSPLLFLRRQHGLEARVTGHATTGKQVCPCHPADSDSVSPP